MFIEEQMQIKILRNGKKLKMTYFLVFKYVNKMRREREISYNYQNRSKNKKSYKVKNKKNYIQKCSIDLI